MIYYYGSLCIVSGADATEFDSLEMSSAMFHSLGVSATIIGHLFILIPHFVFESLYLQMALESLKNIRHVVNRSLNC